MAWFAGIVALDGQFPTEADCTAMASALRKPGRAVRACRTESACFFQSAASPEIGGPLEGHSLSTNAPLVFCDARIDNLDALRERLGTPDADPSTVLSLALAGSTDVPLEDVQGEFAVAAWHGQTRCLRLARDRLGGRPIYYCRTAERFYFATDLPALLAIPSLSKEIDLPRLAELLASAIQTAPDRTGYEAIRVLPGGHRLTLAGGRVLQLRYCREPGTAGRMRQRVVTATGDEYAQSLREHLVNAVSCRLAGGRRIAVHLSGGLDSAAIASIAARQLRQEGRRLIALCSVLPEGQENGVEADEREYMAEVLSQEDNIDAVWIQHSPTHSPFAELPRAFACLGYPIFANASHIDGKLGEAAQALGVDVVLSGFGGDFFASWRGNLVFDFLRSGRLVAAFRQLHALRCRRQAGWWRTLRSEAIGPLVRHVLPGAGRKYPEILAPELLARLQAAGNFQPGEAWLRLARARLHEGWRGLLAPGHLELPVTGMTQFYSRIFGQDLRMPMLDQKVIEFMFSVPTVELQRDGISRSLFRRAMVGILPERIRQREDKGAAFDPAIMSRLLAARDALSRWAQDESCPGWKLVNRHSFLAALNQVQLCARSQWRPEVFQCVLMGGALAAFLDWHAQRDMEGWN